MEEREVKKGRGGKGGGERDKKKGGGRKRVKGGK